jgi:hypothetical protein
VFMQSLPLARHEVVATLSRQVAEVQAAGLSVEQAITVVSRQLKVSPVKVTALVGIQEDTCLSEPS